MNNAVWAMLNETETALLRAAEPSELATLDEDDLLDLHDKIRRARTKYSKLYRRRARAQVGEDASRGRGHSVHAPTAVKAEAFEEVLARVARAVAKAAKAADTLKAERIAAADLRRGRQGPNRPWVAEWRRISLGFPKKSFSILRHRSFIGPGVGARHWSCVRERFGGQERPAKYLA